MHDVVVALVLLFEVAFVDVQVEPMSPKISYITFFTMFSHKRGRSHIHMPALHITQSVYLVAHTSPIKFFESLPFKIYLIVRQVRGISNVSRGTPGGKIL